MKRNLLSYSLNICVVRVDVLFYMSSPRQCVISSVERSRRVITVPKATESPTCSKKVNRYQDSFDDLHVVNRKSSFSKFLKSLWTFSTHV